jgi:hypothetical protein
MRKVAFKEAEDREFYSALDDVSKAVEHLFDDDPDHRWRLASREDRAALLRDFRWRLSGTIACLEHYTEGA